MRLQQISLNKMHGMHQGKKKNNEKNDQALNSFIEAREKNS